MIFTSEKKAACNKVREYYMLHPANSIRFKLRIETKYFNREINLE